MQIHEKEKKVIRYITDHLEVFQMVACLICSLLIGM